MGYIKPGVLNFQLFMIFHEQPDYPVMFEPNNGQYLFIILTKIIDYSYIG